MGAVRKAAIVVVITAEDDGGVTVRLEDSLNGIEASTSVRPDAVRKHGGAYALYRCLSKARRHPSDIRGIIVELKGASFTAARVAVSTANTFGWLHQIPVALAAADGANNHRSLVWQSYVRPLYVRPPHITPPKASRIL